AVPHRIGCWTPKGIYALGTDGFGRSDGREDLRRFFETSAEHIAYAALWGLSQRDQFDEGELPKALRTLDIAADAPDPAIS
ncbi:MAG: hypothetical protein ACE5I3_12390, partial [Phycisphaerae bacterium]